MDKEKWRYQAIRTRLGLALNQNINTDVSFIFGTSDEKTIVSAHKLICQLSSSFLNELITKHEREQKSQARKGPSLISLGSNVCPILFKRLLKVSFLLKNLDLTQIVFNIAIFFVFITVYLYRSN
jgi:hypothetical protein